MVLADRDVGSLSAALARLDDVRASSVDCDATREDDVAGAVDAVVQRHGGLSACGPLQGPAASVLVAGGRGLFLSPARCPVA